MASIRRKLEAASRGVDLGVRTELVDAKVDELRAKLERLSRQSPDIRVRVNAGTALAELEALKRGISDLDGRQSRITRIFSGSALGDVFRSLFTSLRNVSPLLDNTVGKLGDIGDKLKGVADDATAASRTTPFSERSRPAG